MPYKKSKYSAAVNSELKMRVISVLNEASDYVQPTIDWIKQQDMILQPYSSQKIARILGTLHEQGIVEKGKNKSGHMVYRLISHREDVIV